MSREGCANGAAKVWRGREPIHMKKFFLALAGGAMLAVSIAASEPALAQPKHHQKPVCHWVKIKRYVWRNGHRKLVFIRGESCRNRVW